MLDESDDRWEMGRGYDGEDIHSSTVSGTSNLSFNCCILTTDVPLLSVLTSSAYRFSSALPFAWASSSSLAWICTPSGHISVDVVGVTYKDTGVAGCVAVKGERGVVILDDPAVDNDVVGELFVDLS